MRIALFFLFGIVFASIALAESPKVLTIVGSTNYQQTVWTATDMPRLREADLLPTTSQVAAVMNKLDYHKRYQCKSDYYFGSVGGFNYSHERGVVMVYSLSDCVEK